MPNSRAILLKHFKLSISARKKAEKAGLSYKTTLKECNIPRLIITEELAKSAALFEGKLQSMKSKSKENGKRNSDERREYNIMDIIDGDHKLLLTIIPEVSAESLIKEIIRRLSA